MTQDSKGDNGSASADLLQFIQQRLLALSEAFANTPLMRLRVTTARGSVTLVKARTNEATARETDAGYERRRTPRAPHEYVPDGEPGRAYDTVFAEVVGVFHAAPDLPAPGEEVHSDRVLGYIDALKLRTPVKAGFEGRFVGQVAEEGQPVDFGETLFVVDSGPAELQVEETPVEIEPPRI